MITYSINETTGILNLNNPPQNQLPDPEFVNLEELKQFIYNNNLKALLITGSGRHFSNGADLENLKEITKSGHLEMQLSKGKKILSFLENLEIPTVAAVSGVCFGGGLEIALAAHFIITSENALFALPEINHGLIPGLGGTQRIIRRIGRQKALETIFSGDTINAEKALQQGLIDYIVPKKELLTYSVNFLHKLTVSRPLKVINYLIRSLNNYYQLPFEEALTAETALFCELAQDELNRNE